MTGRLLELHMAESDRYEGRPLFEALVEKCRELGVSGVTVFRGLEGFGPTAEMHKARLMGKDQPVVLLAVDKAEVIERAMPAIGEMIGGRMMVLSEVRMKRVERNR